MGWTPLYLEMQDKNVLVVGAGEVGQRRALRFLEAGANVTMTGGHIPHELEEVGVIPQLRSELSKWVEWADLVVVASGDQQLNQEVAHLAKDKLINRADHPEEGNFIVPSSFFIKDVQFSIFTQGKSPIMARQLRKRIQALIQEEDILKMELQHFTRQLLKGKVHDQKNRRDYLYQILNDKKINEFLDKGELEEAQDYVTFLLETQD
ncbi:bifunctional precorrin-2 dehydrogenase/sirohydrochlorin ferrochelatase [uncultured Methanobacterium sp.]|uniref:precorrin-2 dehydrogenase/sirohydrochlorin ferrochelatase family protein n=1 Tax=uncultured Methanobacterium sp. TaxID=176306 RepID=UPI002AA95EC7|nr:bifunctional precorrin-2 dehydrogenase/sirohydrochlorin ferrochelatase [uncultured Methanobacterium sp.]